MRKYPVLSLEEARIKFLEAIFCWRVERGLPFYVYPYMIIGGNRVELAEAISDALLAFPVALRDVLELHYGLRDGRRRTLKETAAEIGLSSEKEARNEQSKALRLIRRQSYKKLKPFLALTPGEIADIVKEIEEIKSAIQRLREEKTSPTVQEAQKKREVFIDFFSGLPNSALKVMVFNALMRVGKTDLVEIKEMLINGRIQEIRWIGKLGENFLRQVLTEQKASP